MASTAYIRMMHTPITTHSRNIARPSGIRGSQRLVYPVGYYTKVKHLVIYNLQFTIYEALYNGNASTDYSCAAKLYIVHCKLYLPLPINIWHYVIQRSPIAIRSAIFAPRQMVSTVLTSGNPVERKCRRYGVLSPWLSGKMPNSPRLPSTAV